MNKKKVKKRCCHPEIDRERIATLGPIIMHSKQLLKFEVVHVQGGDAEVGTAR